MNYEQARQLGADSDAPGKWNWSNRHDDSIYTTGSCAWPDFAWPKDAFDVLTGRMTVEPTGRERCDHDTREEAERHHYEHEAVSLDWRPIDQDMARTLQRCDSPECKEWSTASAYGGGWFRGNYCAVHANADGYRSAHPFVAGMQEIHS